MVPHPTNIKGSWVGIDNIEKYYSATQATIAQKYYRELKQTYRNNPQDEISLGAIASDLRTELAELSPDVYPATTTLAREVKPIASHLGANHRSSVKILIQSFQYLSSNK